MLKVQDFSLLGAMVEVGMCKFESGLIKASPMGNDLRIFRGLSFEIFNIVLRTMHQFFWIQQEQWGLAPSHFGLRAFRSESLLARIWLKMLGEF